MARGRTTRPESVRAKRKTRPSVTQRISQLEVRMDQLEVNVVQRLAQFESTVIEKLSHFSTSEYRGRNLYRGLMVGIGVIIVGVLFYIDGN